MTPRRSCDPHAATPRRRPRRPAALEPRRPAAANTPRPSRTAAHVNSSQEPTMNSSPQPRGGPRVQPGVRAARRVPTRRQGVPDVDPYSARADGREGRTAVHDGTTAARFPRGRRQPAHSRRPTVARPPPLHHPVVVEARAQRAADVQLRIADTITAFAGSMPFVYIHAVAFACWMLFVESDPWPKLTLVVSLEAIFLSTFVMIGQNRQAEFQRAQGRPRLRDRGTGTADEHRTHACHPHPDGRDPSACPGRRSRGGTTGRATGRVGQAAVSARSDPTHHVRRVGAECRTASWRA